jgi:hypothetical protein
LLEDHDVVGSRHACAFVLTDGRQVQLGDSPNKTLELVSNFFRPIVCINLAECVERLKNTRLVE